MFVPGAPSLDAPMPRLGWPCRGEQCKNKTWRRKPNNWCHSCRPTKRGWNVLTPACHRRRQLGGLESRLRQAVPQTKAARRPKGAAAQPATNKVAQCLRKQLVQPATDEVAQCLREQLGLVCSLVGEPAGLEVLACGLRLNRRLGASKMHWACPPVLVAALLCVAMTLAGPPMELRKELREAIAGSSAVEAVLAAEAQLVQAMGRASSKLGVCGPHF